MALLDTELTLWLYFGLVLDLNYNKIKNQYIIDSYSTFDQLPDFVVVEDSDIVESGVRVELVDGNCVVVESFFGVFEPVYGSVVVELVIHLVVVVSDVVNDKVDDKVDAKVVVISVLKKIKISAKFSSFHFLFDAILEDIASKFSSVMSCSDFNLLVNCKNDTIVLLSLINLARLYIVSYKSINLQGLKFIILKFHIFKLSYVSRSK